MRSLFNRGHVCSLCDQPAVAYIASFPVCALHDVLAGKIAQTDRDRRALAARGLSSEQQVQFHVEQRAR